MWSCAIATIVVAIPAAVLAFGGNAGRRIPDRRRHRRPVGAVAVQRLQHHAATDAAPRSRLPARSVIGGGAVVPRGRRQPFRRAVPGVRENQPRHRPAGTAACSTSRVCRWWRSAKSRPAPGCIHMREQALAAVAEHRIGRVFLVARFASYTASRIAGTPPRANHRGLCGTRRHRLPRGAGARAATVRRAPISARGPAASVLRSRRHAQPLHQQTVTRAEHDRLQAHVTAAFASYRNDPRVRVVDFTPVLCDDQTCALGTTREPYYVDDHHLNATGAVLVSDAIARQAELH